METCQTLLRGGNSSKALTSVSGLLSKFSASSKFRLLWESDRRNQIAPLPEDKLLYLKAKTPHSNRALMSSVTPEIDCQFQLEPKGANIHPSQTTADVKDLLHDLIHHLVQIKSPSRHGLNLWGHVTPEKIIVEYGSPNIAKPLHMGHLRSTVMGNCIAQLCKHAGHNVTSMCFLGDWGKQFGTLQAGLNKWGTAEDRSMAESLDKLDIRALMQFYIQASAAKDPGNEMDTQAKHYTTMLERADPSCLQSWSIIREKSIQHLNSAWSQLGIEFDIVQSESEFSMKSHVTVRVLQQLQARGHLVAEDDGCVFAQVPSTLKGGSMAKVPLVKNNGTSIYLLRDIAAGVHRFENLDFDRMIYVADKAQIQHFCNLFHLLSDFGYHAVNHKEAGTVKVPKGKRAVEHLAFGQVVGMSSRAGTFVLLSDAVRDGCEFMEARRKASPNTRWASENEVDAETTLKLTVSALIAYSLKSRRQRDFTFNWVEAIKSTGETGMKLQYTHARLNSLEKQLGFDSDEVLGNPDKFCDQLDFDYLLRDPLAMDLVVHLLNFEDSFWTSYNEAEPCVLLTHLFQLCEKTSKALKDLNVKSETDQSIKVTRQRIFAMCRHILSIGMKIAGITPLYQI